MISYDESCELRSSYTEPTSVDHNIHLSLHHEVPHASLEVHPVAPVESLPLRRDVDEVVGGVHPAVEDKVSVGSHVTSGQVDVRIKVLNILVSQVLTPHQLGYRLPLLVLSHSSDVTVHPAYSPLTIV